LGQSGFTAGVLGLRMLTQAVALVLLARMLAPAAYGPYVSLSALAVMLGLVPQMGAGFLMMARAGRGLEAIRDVWRFSWPQVLVGGVLLLPVMVLLGRWLVAGGDVPLLAVVIIGVTELLVMPMGALLVSYVQAHDRVPFSQLLQWLPFGLRALVIPLCFFFLPAERLLAAASLQLLAAALGVLAISLLVSRRFGIDWQRRRADASELRQGAGYMAMHLVAANPSEIDKLMATRLVGPQEAGIFSVAARVLGAMIMPVMALLLSAQPRLFRMAGGGHGHPARLMALIFLLALGWGGVCAGLLLWGAPVLYWLLGAGFAGIAPLLPWLALAAAPLCLRVAAGPLLVALGHPLERLGLELAGVLAMVGFMLWLAPRYGGVGMAMALLLSETCMAVVGWLLLWRRYFRPSADAGDHVPGQ
jgi:O-antigen/teichoic acid export membrane protein